MTYGESFLLLSHVESSTTSSNMYQRSSNMYQRITSAVKPICERKNPIQSNLHMDVECRCFGGSLYIQSTFLLFYATHLIMDACERQTNSRKENAASKNCVFLSSSFPFESYITFLFPFYLVNFMISLIILYSHYYKVIWIIFISLYMDSNFLIYKYTYIYNMRA